MRNERESRHAPGRTPGGQPRLVNSRGNDATDTKTDGPRDQIETAVEQDVTAIAHEGSAIAVHRLQKTLHFAGPIEPAVCGQRIPEVLPSLEHGIENVVVANLHQVQVV